MAIRELLLATKFHVPRLPVQHVSRERLVALLERGATGSLTLVSAPAGSGKTTLLSEWTRATTMSVAWLSLESADNEPARLLAYLLAALQTLDERIGRQSTGLPDTQAFAEYERILSGLVNDLTLYVSTDVALVLDDYHVLEHEDVQHILRFLLEHTPEHFHLILGTRVDPPLPLARLRVRGHLYEIGAELLRFADEEVEAFLRSMQLELDRESLENLEKRTEGWIAGVQLAALALRGRSDQAAFLENFRGSHRFILEYLSEEILSHQASHVRIFLLQTSIVERLSGSLCDALMEQSGSQALLEELRRANLFISALDDNGEWYRYHALFAEGLRYQLEQQEPTLVSRLYARASAWYEAHDMLYEACDAALQAQDFLHAASLVERLASRMIGRVEFSILRRWLGQLPAQLIAERPLLKVAGLWISLTEDSHPGGLEQAIALLQQNFQGHETEINRVAWAEAQANLNFVRIMQALGQNDPAKATELAQQTLQTLPEEASYMRSLAWLCLRITQASAHRLSGDFDAAEQAFVEASIQVRQTEFHFLNLIATVSLIEMYEARGALRKMARLYEQLLQMLRTNKHVLSEMTIWIATGYAKLMLQWNRLDEAETYVEMARLAEQRVEIPELALMYRFVQFDLSLARGKSQEAWELLETIETDLAAMPSYPARELVMQARVRVLLLSDRVDEASSVMNASGLKYDDPLKEPPNAVLFVQYITLARMLIAQARTSTMKMHLTQVLDLLERLRALCARAGMTGCLIEILLLTSLALQIQGQLARALLTLEQALALAEPGGFIRLFINEGEALSHLLTRLLAQKSAHSTYIRKLLLATSSAPLPVQTEPAHIGYFAPTVTPLEPLSMREQEVLVLLATGLSNQEIAARLVIAPNTAKRHVKNILGKLGATNRTHAVARARELGLLDQA